MDWEFFFISHNKSTSTSINCSRWQLRTGASGGSNDETALRAAAILFGG